MKVMISLCLLLATFSAMAGEKSKKITDDEAYIIVKKLSSSDPLLEKVFVEMKKCAQAKSSDCLSKLEKDSDKVKRMVKYIEMAETSKYCKMILKKEDGYTDVQKMDEIMNQYTVQDSPLVWRKVSEMADLYKKDVNVILTMDEFHAPQEIVLERVFTRELPCENSVDLKVKLTKFINEWKITDFVTYSRVQK